MLNRKNVVNHIGNIILMDKRLMRKGRDNTSTEYSLDNWQRKTSTMPRAAKKQHQIKREKGIEIIKNEKLIQKEKIRAK